jgi:hypothetical protein
MYMNVLGLEDGNINVQRNAGNTTDVHQNISGKTLTMAASSCDALRLFPRRSSEDSSTLKSGESG